MFELASRTVGSIASCSPCFMEYLCAGADTTHSYVSNLDIFQLH